ncbi:hypothetical protein, partial [Candidatus Pyrohabitans sp.]
AGAAGATVPGQPWWFPDYYYSVDHTASPDVFESSIAWDRSNDNGEWFGLLEVYDHEIRWGGSEWSSESELRSKYDYEAAYSNLPGAYTTGVEWNSGENRAELEVVSGSSQDIQDRSFYYVDFWMETLGSTTKTVEVFIKSELGALPGFPNPLDPRAVDYRFIGADCFVPPPSGYRVITIYPPTKSTPACSSSQAALSQLSTGTLAKPERFNASEYVKKKKFELASLSKKMPTKRAYTTITFKRPVSFDSATDIARKAKIKLEAVDLKYTNSYAFVKYGDESKTRERIAGVTKKINSRHRELGLSPAYLEGVIAIRGYAAIGNLNRISGSKEVALADFSLEDRSLPFIYYEFQR